jgi:hypothetical protein
MVNRNHLAKLFVITMVQLIIYALILGIIFLVSGCGSFKQGRTDPCFYSDKCLSDVIEREGKAQKDYYHGR